MENGQGTGTHESDALRQLAARVSLLEQEVAALKRAGAPAIASEPVPGAPAIASEPVPGAPPPDAIVPPPPTRFRPLPPFAARLLPNEQPAPPAPARSLEDRLGSQVFNRIGIVALLIAASWGLRLAFQNGWIGPTGRIAIGLLAGAGLVLWSERFRHKGFAAFSYSLKAVGTGVLYLSLWASFQLYALLPAAAALALMIAITAWNAYLAWSQDSELLAAYSLSGAFATPLLLSTGGNHEVFLFTYIGSVDLAALLLIRLKPWPRLLLSALAGTVLFYGGWLLRFYSPGFSYTTLLKPPFALTAAYLLGFATLFAAASVRGVLRWQDADSGTPGATPQPGTGQSWGRSPVILSVLVPLLNASFLALALSSLVAGQYPGEPLPWVMVALAAVYLALARVQRTVAAAAVHLAIAVVFLTVAIPLKASGHTLTVAWFAEGLALLWASLRASSEGQSGALSPARVLRALSAASYLLGVSSLLWFRCVAGGFNPHSFFSASLCATLFGALCLALAAWLSLSPPRAAKPLVRFGLGAYVALDLVALLLASREFAPRPGDLHPFFNPIFAHALLALALLAGTLYGLLRLAPPQNAGGFRTVAAVTSVLFNLAAILSVETEINALWQRSDANLQRSLAVSGFLMLYGAALLAAGFLRRSAFTRWQALLLILFTILKVFLYDMSSLREGYRVLSFFGLGVLLLAVSFAYQRDWLGLKTSSLPETRP